MEILPYLWLPWIHLKELLIAVYWSDSRHRCHYITSERTSFLKKRTRTRPSDTEKVESRSQCAGRPASSANESPIERTTKDGFLTYRSEPLSLLHHCARDLLCNFPSAWSPFCCRTRLHPKKIQLLRDQDQNCNISVNKDDIRRKYV